MPGHNDGVRGTLLMANVGLLRAQIIKRSVRLFCACARRSADSEDVNAQTCVLAVFCFLENWRWPALNKLRISSFEVVC